MKNVDENSYKYLGVLQAIDVQNHYVKEKVRNEHMQRVKLLTKS